ncbi:MAG: MFS transporter [Clostridia bacterium]|nr:MFS transporter [Clostridia bacterium]
MSMGSASKAAYGLGAVGKDMVYALSASYVMYYYQDVLGLSPSFVGLVLMIARIFDALNDPFMGVLVARTRSRWGRFRPWLVSGAVLNAFTLYALFAAPAADEGRLMVWFTGFYLLWGITYTMMDIPFWSMIPAAAESEGEREKLTVVGRTCAGVGSALVSVLLMPAVGLLGGGSEREGFRLTALIISAVFALTALVCGAGVRERRRADQPVCSVRDMLKALLRNDQALKTAGAVVLINMAMYITANVLTYFFKYDVAGPDWRGSYSLFSMAGGVFYTLGMVLLYPMLRRRLSNQAIFRLALALALLGYALLLLLCLTGAASSLPALLLPGALVFASNGLTSVLTTIFLSDAVDYGERLTGQRQESLVFSLQTFVVKAASGLAVFITGLCLESIGLGGSVDTAEILSATTEALLALRLTMTLLPMAAIVGAGAAAGRREEGER